MQRRTLIIIVVLAALLVAGGWWFVDLLRPDERRAAGIAAVREEARANAVARQERLVGAREELPARIADCRALLDAWHAPEHALARELANAIAQTPGEVSETLLRRAASRLRLFRGAGAATPLEEALDPARLSPTAIRSAFLEYLRQSPVLNRLEEAFLAGACVPVIFPEQGVDFARWEDLQRIVEAGSALAVRALAAAGDGDADAAARALHSVYHASDRLLEEADFEALELGYKLAKRGDRMMPAVIASGGRQTGAWEAIESHFENRADPSPVEQALLVEAAYALEQKPLGALGETAGLVAGYDIFAAALAARPLLRVQPGEARTAFDELRGETWEFAVATRNLLRNAQARHIEHANYALAARLVPIVIDIEAYREEEGRYPMRLSGAVDAETLDALRGGLDPQQSLIYERDNGGYIIGIHGPATDIAWRKLENAGER